MSKIELVDSQILDIVIEEPADIQSFFLFGIHKCGSTLMNKIFVDLCLKLQIPCIAIARAAFQQGIPDPVWGRSENLNSIIMDGYCYRGFRNYPVFLKGNSLINSRKKILLVRDPRDAIVSAYFSFANSHKKPGEGAALQQFIEMRERLQGLDIESYTIEHSHQVKKVFDRYYEQLNPDSLLKVYRYEDVIFNKFDWIKDILNFLDLSLEDKEINAISKRHDIVPKNEDTGNHIRKVKPGDHKEKLSPDCILKLNEILSDVLKRYNYSF